VASRQRPRIVWHHGPDTGASRPPTRSEYLGEIRTVREGVRLPLHGPRLARTARASRGAQESGSRRVTALVLPGLAASDRSTGVLRAYLRAAGIDAQGWGLGVNRGNVAALLPKVRARTESLLAEGTGPLALIGWSLGGILARETARDVPDVAAVITLATPILGPRHTIVASQFGDDAALRDIEEQFRARAAAEPLRCAVLAFHSRRDGIAHWRACIDDAPNVTNVEVRSTHVGMGIDPTVLRRIVAQLMPR
jgi:pimeloyl-ACP methyl ester carboxylesterase